MVAKVQLQTICFIFVENGLHGADLCYKNSYQQIRIPDFGGRRVWASDHTWLLKRNLNCRGFDQF